MIQYTNQSLYYSRDPKIVGNDIDLLSGEDIKLTNSGDIQLITNVESISKAIIRRLYTSKLDYERLLKTTDGLIISGESFGNDAFSYLSSLNNSLNRDYIIQEIERIFRDENRVDLQSIEFLESNSDSVEIEVKYIILSNNRLATLVI
jgi:hypothetical protein